MLSLPKLIVRPVLRANVCARTLSSNFTFPTPDPDLGYLLDPKNRSKILENVEKRLEINPERAQQKLDQLETLKQAFESDPTAANQKFLLDAAVAFPNQTHPDVINLTEPKLLQETNSWICSTKITRPFEEIGRILAGVRWENNAQISTDRSYYLIGQLAELEHALIRYSVNSLLDVHDFQLISVPDLLHPEILRGCGMDVDGERTQVYKLDPTLHPPIALSGTAEMAIGGFLMNKKINFPNQKNPVKKLVAVSRCYRAESSRGQAEKGIYRVHHFTKVEMFAVTPPDIQISDSVHQEFLEIQKRLFSDLGLSFKILDMPPNDLGSPAYRKFDIEAFLPGKKSKNPKDEALAFGEISSTSNCTDYQSRRLNIQTTDGQYVHTVNGTACAVPRMIMAICEQFQTENGCVTIPTELIKYLPHRGSMKAPGLIEPKPRKSRPIFRYIRGPKFFQNKFKEQCLRKNSLEKSERIM